MKKTSSVLCGLFVWLFFLLLGVNGNAALIAQWQLDGNADDLGPNGLNGNIIGTLTPTADRFGNPNGALSFSGSGYVQVNDAAPMQVASHSISLWFTWDGLGAGDVNYLIAKGFENFEIHTGGGSGTDGIRYIPSDGHYNDNASIIHAGWNHLVVTFDNATDTSVVYLDGVEQGVLSQATGGTVLGNFSIGARTEGGTLYEYNGDIDDVRLFDTVLTQTEVTQLFVPEPSRALLSLVGIAAIGLRRRRRS